MNSQQQDFRATLFPSKKEISAQKKNYKTISLISNHFDVKLNSNLIQIKEWNIKIFPKKSDDGTNLIDLYK